MNKFNFERQSNLIPIKEDYSSDNDVVRIVRVSNVLVEKKFQPLITNLLGSLIGLICIFTFKIIWLIIGLILLGVCGFNCYDLISNKRYIIDICYSDGKEISYNFDSIEKAIEFQKSSIQEVDDI